MGENLAYPDEYGHNYGSCAVHIPLDISRVIVYN